MAALVDTNVLVYRYDSRFPAVYGMRELLSEDFADDRLYGSVRAVNPFLDLE